MELERESGIDGLAVDKATVEWSLESMSLGREHLELIQKQAVKPR
jgi:hypothetical protein